MQQTIQFHLDFPYGCFALFNAHRVYRYVAWSFEYACWSRINFSDAGIIPMTIFARKRVGSKTSGRRHVSYINRYSGTLSIVMGAGSQKIEGNNNRWNSLNWTNVVLHVTLWFQHLHIQHTLIHMREGENKEIYSALFLDFVVSNAKSSNAAVMS